MTAALEKLHEEAGHDKDSLKHRVGEIVTSYRFELFLMLFIFADMGLVAVELGVDHHLFCIGGEKVQVGREELKEIAESGGSQEGGEEGPTAAHFLASPPTARSRGGHLPHAPAARPHSGAQASHSFSFLQEWRASAPEVASSPAGPEEGAKKEGWGLAEGPGPRLQGGLSKGRDSGARLPQSQRVAMAGGTPVSVDPDWGVDPTDVHPVRRGRYAPERKERAERVETQEKEELRRGGEEEESGEEEEEEREEEAALVCEDRHGHHAHHISHTCHLWSIIILVVFEVELMIKIWVSPEHFFKNPYHVFDLVVVSLSLFIDTVFMTVVMFFTKDVDEGTVDIAAAVLLTTRIWRIVRIVHGIFEVVHAQKEEMDDLEGEVSEAKTENEKLEEKIRSLESRSG